MEDKMELQLKTAPLKPSNKLQPESSTKLITLVVYCAMFSVMFVYVCRLEGRIRELEARAKDTPVCHCPVAKPPVAQNVSRQLQFDGQPTVKEKPSTSQPFSSSAAATEHVQRVTTAPQRSVLPQKNDEEELDLVNDSGDEGSGLDYMYSDDEDMPDGSGEPVNSFYGRLYKPQSLGELYFGDLNRPDERTGRVKRSSDADPGPGRRHSQQGAQSRRRETEDSTQRPSKRKARRSRRQNTVAAAHFFAPRGEDKVSVSDSTPPATFRFWKAEDWTREQTFFSLNNRSGIVTIRENGIYLIYAQLVYHDLTGRWSFGVYVDDRERLKCMNTEQMRHPHQRRTDDASASHGVYQHCYTAAVLQLRRHQHLSIRCLYGSRTVVMQPEFTFWGIVKLTA